MCLRHCMLDERPAFKLKDIELSHRVVVGHKQLSHHNRFLVLQVDFYLDFLFFSK